MVGKTNVAGARLRAVIAVTYPVGSICTCSNGTKTLKARDTSGKALFNVTVGEWTVSCTDGSSTAGSMVSITAEGQIESVALNYELVLYDSGDQHSTVTGGWKNNSGTFTLNSDSMVLEGEYHADASAFINNLVDLTDYNTLYFTLAYSDDSSGRSGAIGISKSNTNAAPSYAASISGINGNVSKTTKSIDISSITGSYYVGFSVNQNKMTVYKVWAV